MKRKDIIIDALTAQIETMKEDSEDCIANLKTTLEVTNKTLDIVLYYFAHVNKNALAELEADIDKKELRVDGYLFNQARAMINYRVTEELGINLEDIANQNNKGGEL